MKFPAYMEKGSEGPAVNLVLAFLIGWARGHAQDIHCDGVYGEVGVRWAKEFQGAHATLGLEPDGGIGPKTRGVMKDQYGFDFEAAARSTGGTTIFVQQDGTTKEWSPGAEEAARRAALATHDE